MVMALLCGCSTTPDELPFIRIRNDRDAAAEIRVSVPSGVTILIENIAPSSATDYQSFESGELRALAIIESEMVLPNLTFVAQSNKSYTIIIADTAPPHTYPHLTVKDRKVLPLPTIGGEAVFRCD